MVFVKILLSYVCTFVITIPLKTRTFFTGVMYKHILVDWVVKKKQFPTSDIMFRFCSFDRISVLKNRFLNLWTKWTKTLFIRVCTLQSASSTHPVSELFNIESVCSNEVLLALYRSAESKGCEIPSACEFFDSIESF